MPDANPPRQRRLPHDLTACLVAVAICVVAVAMVLRLHRADLSVPFQYEHDSFTNIMMIKTMVDCGWWMTNDHLGAPFRFEFHDYPMNPNVHFLVLKGMSLFTSDPARLLNLYFLLTFPLITLAAYAALRATGANPPVSVVFSVLYAFLPFHFWRNVAHLFLAAYFMIPLLALMIAWLARGESVFLVRKPDGRLGLRLFGWREAVAVLICLGCGLDFPYYSLFALILLGLAGIVAAVFQREWRVLGTGLALVAVTGVGVAINLGPNFAYRWEHGPNPAGDHIATARPWTDCEVYALKPIQMMLPALGHRVRSFRELRDRYYSQTTSTLSSNDSLALGAVGAVGLVVLLSALVWAHRLDSPSARVHHLTSVLTAGVFLLGGVGGFSVLPGLFGVTIVRCYDRLSIFIGFFALAAFAFVVDAVLRRCWASSLGRAVALAVLAGLLVLGIADQTGHTYMHPLAETRREWNRDADFVAQVEQSVPAGSMIFQLPYISFCSYTNSANKMQAYSHFRGYFHSHSLRWSFGAMHGRLADLVHAAVADRPLEAGLGEMAYLGFAGVYVDRFGYKDNGEKVEKQLRELLGREPIVSDDGRLSFYRLVEYSERLRGTCSEEAWAARRQAVLDRPLAQWGHGVWPEEKAGAQRWRWCGRRAELSFYNPADRPQVMKVRFKARAAHKGRARLVVKGSGVDEVVDIAHPGTVYSREITVPPGRHTLALTSDARNYVAPGRTLVFVLVDAEVAPLKDQLAAGSAAP